MTEHDRSGKPAVGRSIAGLSGESLRTAGRFLTYLWPYRGKFAAAQVCLLLSTLAGLGFPYFTGRFIDSALRGAGSAAVDGAGPASGLDMNAIAPLLILLLAVQTSCSFLQSYWLSEVGERSLADLRRDTYAHLIRMPMAFFNERRVGELSSRLAADLTMIQRTLTGTIPGLLRLAVLLGGGLFLIAWTSIKLTLVMLMSVPVVVALAAVLGRRIRRFARDAQDTVAATNVVVEETLHGIACVKAFTNEGYETRRYRSAIDSTIATVLRAARFEGALGAFISFAFFGSIISVMWYGGRLIAARELTFGGLAQFLLYTMYVGAAAMGEATRHFGELQRAVGVTQRVRELLAEKPEDLDRAPAVLPGPSPAGPASLARLVGNVAFEGVTFAYASRQEVTVLCDLWLRARAGERIALVGPSGAGKSTIVSLLLRFHDPDSGRILLDGRDARDYSLHDLRGQMAIVPQDVQLWGATIAENIAYGRPGASAAEIEAAAIQANAHDFIMGFPDGYQTLIGDRGIKLSGGQRQRVAIARAILKDPAILILDEATSSLDSESESLVQQAFDNLMQGRTSVIIAHRLATVRQADRIFVIKDGQVVDSGTHEHLSAQPGGLYRTLCELQFGVERVVRELPKMAQNESSVVL